MRVRLWTYLGLLCIVISAGGQSAGAPAQSDSASVLGNWREPGGSVLEIYRCGGDVCARLVALSSTARGKLDANNPDRTLRTRALCGMDIGRGFHLSDAAHADGGRLYDPKSGKTYKGSMTLENGRLLLRGYVGIKAFGRTEVWRRASRPAASCETPSPRPPDKHRS